MKKLVLFLSVITLLTSCGTSAPEGDAPKCDSTGVCCDSTKSDTCCVKSDTLSTDTIR